MTRNELKEIIKECILEEKEFRDLYEPLEESKVLDFIKSKLNIKKYSNIDKKGFLFDKSNYNSPTKYREKEHMNLDQYTSRTNNDINKYFKDNNLDYFASGLYQVSQIDEEKNIYRAIYVIYPRYKNDATDEHGKRISTVTNSKYIENFKKIDVKKLENILKDRNETIFPHTTYISNIHDISCDADFILVYFSYDTIFAMS